MPVLVEALSVIVRRDAIEQKYPGGWPAFCTRETNATFCYDDEIARVGFMAPQDVIAYIERLESYGLIFVRDGKAVDLAAMDQCNGAKVPCDWLEFAKFKCGDGEVAACWLFTEPRMGHGIHIKETDLKNRQLELATPDGWQFEGSLSQTSIYAPEAEMSERAKFLENENGVDIYLDLKTGKEIFAGRRATPPTEARKIFEQLKAIATEARDLGFRKNEAEDAHNAEEAEAIRGRLGTELLPQAEDIMHGPGAGMAFSYFTAGFIHRVLGEYEQAETLLKKALSLQPGVVNTLLELTFSLGEQHKHEEALLYARQAVEVEPEIPETLGNLASCLFDCGQKAEAKAAIEHALSLDPHNKVNLYIKHELLGGE